VLTLVTGASGHVGVNLVPRLLEQGRGVRVLVHERTTGLDGLDVEQVTGDVTDPVAVRAACRGADVVYHLAVVISIRGSLGGLVERVNVEGTENVLRACEAEGVRRLVHFSSIHALDPEPLGQPVDETRPLLLHSRAAAYDRSKAEAESRVLQAVEQGLDAVVLNPVGIVGPLDHRPSLMGEVLRKLRHGKLPGLVSGGFPWADVRDVAAASIAAEERGQRGERYILGGHLASVADLAALVEELSGVRAPRFTSPLWLARIGAPFMTWGARLTGSTPLYTAESLATLEHYQQVDGSKAERELGYSPRPLRDTVRDTLHWFEQAESSASARAP
jgi:dihydroflavonol-4-reductase